MNRLPVGFVLVITSLVVTSAIAAPARSSAPPDLTTLLRNQTQQMCDAVAAGDSTVWDRYLSKDVLYADEAGEISDRATLVSGIQPLPKGISGNLALENFSVHPHGATAVTSFVVNETETYFGQTLHARYLTTNTWQKEAPGWRLIAAQSLALLAEPDTVALPAAKLDEYAGIYELTPDITYTIHRDGSSLVGQRSGRSPQRLRAELADVFFVPGQLRLRKLFQRDAAGRVTGFLERRESWSVVWKRRPG